MIRRILLSILLLSLAACHPRPPANPLDDGGGPLAPFPGDDGGR